MTAIKRSAQASLVLIQSGTLPPARSSQSWTATSCPASLRVQAIQCALVRSAELKLMKNFCPIAAPLLDGVPGLLLQLLESCIAFFGFYGVCVLRTRFGFEYLDRPPIQLLGFGILALSAERKGELVVPDRNPGMILAEGLFTHLNRTPIERF